MAHHHPRIAPLALLVFPQPFFVASSPPFAAFGSDATAEASGSHSAGFQQKTINNHR